MNERLIPVTDVTYVYFRWTGPLSLYGHVCHWHQISLCAYNIEPLAVAPFSLLVRTLYQQQQQQQQSPKQNENLSTNHVYMCALFPNKIY